MQIAKKKIFNWISHYSGLSLFLGRLHSLHNLVAGRVKNKILHRQEKQSFSCHKILIEQQTINTRYSNIEKKYTERASITIEI